MTDRFAIEAERHRSMYDYREQLSVPGILVPFFLHLYYARKKRLSTASLLLRESVAMCQLLELDKEGSYLPLDVLEQGYRRKIFWLLFVTERGHAMHHNVGVSLPNSIRLPQAEEDPDPHLLTAFLSLVRLFVAVDGTLIGTQSGNTGPAYSREAFATLQEQLRQPSMSPSNEVQKADIIVTNLWMRTLVWQLAMKHVPMTTSRGGDTMSLTYPVCVAEDSLAFLSKVSLDSLIAHGSGMEFKLFEITNTLLDVINCVPSLQYENSSLMQTGPQDIFHQLSCLLSDLSRGQSPIVALLQSKMAQSTVPMSPVPRLLELNNNNLVPAPFSDDVNSGGSTSDWDSATQLDKDADTSTGPEDFVFQYSTGAGRPNDWMRE